MAKFSALTLLGVILAVAAVASGMKLRRTKSLHNLIENNSKVCMGLIEKENRDFLGRNFYDNNNAHDAHRCYDACVWKKSGLFNDNTFDLKNLAPTRREAKNQRVRRQANTMLYTCVGYVHEIADECVKAATFSNCLRYMRQQQQ